MNKIFSLLISLILFSIPVFAMESFVYEELPISVESKNYSENIIKKYDYTSTVKIPIYLQINKKYKTSGKTKVGDEFMFTATRNVYYNGELLVKKGEQTTAKLTHFIRRGMNGIPSIMILEGFEFANIDSKKLDGKYMKRGFDNTLFVLPLKWVLTPLYPLGSFSNLIIGCETRITPNNEIVIYYYPEWIIE